MVERLIGGRYVLTRKILSGDRSRGLPDLWQARDAGDIYYIKLWKRTGDDRDIRALWNREVRSLMRLQGYPGASEFFVRLYDLHAGDEHFYAVLEGGQNILLASALENRSQYNWLQNLAEVGRRRFIWDGLLRIAEALSILHREGTLHRALNSSAVFTAPGGKGEFRLSGFEWAIRVAGDGGAGPAHRRKGQLRAPELDNQAEEYSTATDWFDFGTLAAEVLGLQVRTFRKRESLRVAISHLSQFRDIERATLTSLVAERPDDRLSDAEAVTQALREIIRDLSSVAVGSGRKLVLGIRLGPNVALSKAVASASENKAKADDPIAQLKWVRHDLRGDVRITARASPSAHFIARGAKLEYRVRPWTANNLSTWDIGFCESVDTAPRVLADDQHYSMGLRELDIESFSSIRKSQQTIRDRSAPWDRVFAFAKARTKMDPHLRDIHDFFRITQQLDTLFMAAQIWPVEVLEVERSSSDTQIKVTPWVESARNNLALHLGLDNPDEQMRDWFRLGAEPVVADDDEDPDRDTYSLLQNRTIDSDGSNANWHFVAAKPDPKGPVYVFRCEGNPEARIGKLFLARSHGGNLKQIRRRHKAIEDLRSHEDLLRMLFDPAGASRTISEALPKQKALIPLDSSKLRALERLWRTQPSFAIQGPPGTGKTTLIQAFADRLYSSDATAQILVSGHSHHTVDHVRTKLDELFGSGGVDAPILVRLAGKKPTKHDVGPVAGKLLRRFRDSSLAQSAPAHLRQRLEALEPTTGERTENADVDFRTMQSLVQEAANLTFATSNSAELAEVIEKGRRFDWSIIEEAGKAHGFDMAAALQASHRLLLIGDHYQLPPFNARLFKDLLGEPLRVRKAIETGAQFARGLVDPSIVEEDEDRAPFVDRCQGWREMVTIFGRLFERSLVTEDLAQGQAEGPAATLTDQHRMHPDIAELVGKIFYPDDAGGTIINSPQETYDRFAGAPPFSIRPGWMTHHRIVWCDVPWIQTKEFSEGEVAGLFVAPTETEIVIRALDQFEPVEDKACEFQILSPYNDQLKDIRDGIDRARQAGKLGAMFMPPFDLREKKRLGATVDEFQGGEADVVVVSLVRNNGLPPWASIGFLKEANRMDVLLSRARHKLIIVGSWKFWASRCDATTPKDAEYAYIGRMIDHFKTGIGRDQIRKIEFSK